MPNHNRVTLIGNLTDDPELRFLDNGKALTKFSIAINRKYKQDKQEKDEVCYVEVTTWGKLAEACGEYLEKGKAVFIDGRLNFNTWETKEGQKKTKFNVVANSVDFLSSSKNNG